MGSPSPSDPGILISTRRGRVPPEPPGLTREPRRLACRAPGRIRLSGWNREGQNIDAQNNAARLTPPAATVFRATVHGLAFADRTRHLKGLRRDVELVLIPAPPGPAPDEVWIHLEDGDPLGHLPPEIAGWLGPWIRQGGAATARVVKVGDEAVPTWRRLLVEVTCAEIRNASSTSLE